MIDDGTAALNHSTHTIHTSIVRPHRAVWPFGKALTSWFQGGPFDVQVTPSVLPFIMHSALRSLCDSEIKVHTMWRAFRRLGCESRQLYLDLNHKLGPIFIGKSGRGHLASPLVEGDKDSVLGLHEKLVKLGVESHLLTDKRDIQQYVGDLPVQAADLIATYPEDFVLDLPRFKASILDAVKSPDNIRLQETVEAIDRDSNGTVVTLTTKGGKRIHTDALLYAGGWRATGFLKRCFGIDLRYQLCVAAGVRFAVPGHLIHRSIVCGPMFLAPGTNASGQPATDIGQMFLVNNTSPHPLERHLNQAVARFRTYFDHRGEVTDVRNCVGRPITASGLPFLERIAPNVVAALGPGMFGVSVAPGLAKRALDMLLENKIHPDHGFFERKSLWQVIPYMIPANLTLRKRRSAESVLPRVIQLGRRGAMTRALQESLAVQHDFTVHSARDIKGVVQDIRASPGATIIVATHGSQAKLPVHYGQNYLHADQALRLLLQYDDLQMSAVITISGGIPKDALRELQLLARTRGIRFIYLPGLATSMEALLDSTRSLLACVARPDKITLQDTFHRGKKEMPSAGTSQALGAVAKRYGSEQLLILLDGQGDETKMGDEYPGSIVRRTDGEDSIQRCGRAFSKLIPVVVRSDRIDVPYRYQHRFAIEQGSLVVALEQKLSDRAQLLTPVHEVIRSVPSLPPGFSGTGLSLIIPSIAFRTGGAGLLDGLKSIVLSLHEANVVHRILSRSPSPSVEMEGLLRRQSGRAMSFNTSPSLACSLRVEAGIDGQDFSVSVYENNGLGESLVV